MQWFLTKMILSNDKSNLKQLLIFLDFLLNQITQINTNITSLRAEEVLVV